MKGEQGMDNKNVFPDYDQGYELLSPKELASYLHVGRDKAYSLMKNPSFPSIKIGGRYMVTLKELYKWLDNSKHKTVVL